MRLRAAVHGEGKTLHSVWDAAKAKAVPVDAPVLIEILEEGSAAYLLRLNADARCVADTWHEDVQAAKRQAAFEYGVGEEDWVVVS